MMMTDVSEESLLDYFYSVGGNSGKVKNADLLKTYKPFIGHSDPQLRAKYREEFKLIIDRIASVKSENGEKYLVLKKKYRQLLQDRDTEHGGTNGDRQRHSSPARTPGTAQWEGPVTSSPCCPKKDVRVVPSASTAGPTERGSGQVMCCGGPSITVTEAADHTESQEDQLSLTIQSTQEAPVQIEEPMAHINAEDDIDKDSVSKSESEQDEEGMGSIGSPAVALDPIEKEWIYSAAGARVPTLSELLRQDPSLANKKDFTSGFTALHWAAKHGKEDMATLVANAGADVNTKSHGGYTPLHIAALHGHRHILDLLRTYGANEKLRDYSGRLACHYLNITGGPEEDSEMQFQVTQATEARERSRNRKLTSLFQSKKKWGSAEELAPIEEERSAPQQLMLPAYRSRKFSR